MSSVYDPNKVRGQATFPPPGPGLVNLSGFADGDFVTPEMNNADAVTYSRVDGVGVHTVARDTAGGLLRIRLQYAADANIALQALAAYQFEAGKPNQIIRGVVSVTDPNRSTTWVCSDCVLANNPIGAYANEQPVIEYVFRGTLSRVNVPIPALVFGPSSP